MSGNCEASIHFKRLLIVGCQKNLQPTEKGLRIQGNRYSVASILFLSSIKIYRSTHIPNPWFCKPNVSGSLLLFTFFVADFVSPLQAWVYILNK